MVEVKSKVQRYESYKESGVEWLGEIPEHWEVHRLKNQIDMITGYPFKSEKYTDKGIKLARGINVKEGVLDWKETRFWPEIEKHLVDYLLKDGDVLIAMDGSKVGKNFCQIKESDLPILLLQRVARLRPKVTLTSNYLYFNIVNRNFLLWVEMTKTDPMVPHIAPADIKNFQILIPPLPEQTQIAQFLDDKTTKIDDAIAIKQQQINLLKERKQILIHKAVTRGLDDSVPLKDSGVEWIGEIPEGWDICHLKWLSKIYAGGTPDKTNLSYWQNGTIPWIASGEVNQDTVTKPTTYITELGLRNSSARWIEKDSLVVALAGQGKTKGMVAYIDFNTTGNQSLAALKANKERMESKYLFVFLKAAYSELRGVSGEGKRDGLNLQKLGNLDIPIPPLSEQKEISTYIETASQKIETAIGLKQQEIAKLKEYKSSLINGVVTGKVRVC